MKQGEADTLHVSVGYACNNACVFCMESYVPDDRFAVVKGLMAEDRMYRDMDTHTHLRKVSFGRGEPTLNPDLPKYVAYAKKKGFREIAVISNGRRYADRAYCLTLVESGVNEFIVSVHGHVGELHEALTRGKGGFVEVERGLRNLAAIRERYPIRIVVNHVVNRVNAPFIGHFLKFMKGYPVDVVVLSIVQPIWGESADKLFPLLMPRYSDVADRIGRIRKKAPDLFFSRAGREYVSIIDLPRCCAEALAKHIGFKEERVSELDRGGPDAVAVSGKGRGPRCGECAYGGVCGGVYDEYANRFGWDEFVPVKR